MISLLTRCTPCKYVFVNERAKRQGEEGALLCRAALPAQNLILLLTMVKSASAKIPILRLFEQVYGSELDTLNKRHFVQLLKHCDKSVLIVSDYFAELASKY